MAADSERRLVLCLPPLLSFLHAHFLIVLEDLAQLLRVAIAASVGLERQKVLPRGVSSFDQHHSLLLIIDL